ncbi:MAG TPA: hypothetical protein VHI52_14685, partial [Verrucomicrobiae bacterium]|nr:hypothetical protein [Verrucomicrobiae bacterium]
SFQPEAVEDYAEARLDLLTGAVVRLACSWKLPAGCDAQISGSFYGTKAGARFHNVGGSFYEFEAEYLRGTHRHVLTEGKEEWGGRAAVEWARRLGSGSGFNPEVEELAGWPRFSTRSTAKADANEVDHGLGLMRTGRNSEKPKLQP